MATLNLAIPQTGLVSPSNWGSRASIVSMMNRIIDNYGGYLKFASDNSKIPIEVLAAFIAVESGGNPSAGRPGHVTQGLMQWNREYIYATLEAEYKMGRLSPAEKSKLASYGLTFDANGKLNRKVTNADQLKPELNIVIGSILLGQMLDSYFDGGKKTNIWGVDKDGTLRLDRVIAVYNAGPYGDIGKAGRLGNHPSPKDLANAVPEPTKSYIKKIMGTNGALDVATKELAPKISKIA